MSEVVVEGVCVYAERCVFILPVLYWIPVLTWFCSARKSGRNGKYGSVCGLGSVGVCARFVLATVISGHCMSEPNRVLY